VSQGYAETTLQSESELKERGADRFGFDKHFSEILCLFILFGSQAQKRSFYMTTLRSSMLPFGNEDDRLLCESLGATERFNSIRFRTSPTRVGKAFVVTPRASSVSFFVLLLVATSTFDSLQVD
jgi:hypothetical protein